MGPVDGPRPFMPLAYGGDDLPVRGGVVTNDHLVSVSLASAWAWPTPLNPQ